MNKIALHGVGRIVDIDSGHPGMDALRSEHAGVGIYHGLGL